MVSEPRAGVNASVVAGSWTVRSIELGDRDKPPLSPFSKSSAEVRRWSETAGSPYSCLERRRCIRIDDAPPKMAALCLQYGCSSIPSTSHQSKTTAPAAVNPAIWTITMGGIAVWGKNEYARQMSPPPNVAQAMERSITGMLPTTIFTHSEPREWNFDRIQREDN